MSCTYWSDLVHDFEDILQDDDQFDVIIKAGQHPDVAEFRAHSFILRARCPYFKQAFRTNWSEKTGDGHYIFKKPNISARVFKIILRYLYTGTIDYEQHETEEIVQCVIAADELCLLKMIKKIEGYFCENPDILQEDVVSTLISIYKIISAKDLTDRCLETICGSPELLLSSEKFSDLEKPIITMILHREDLQMSDVDVWDLLIRWVTAHYLIRKQDATRSLGDAQNQAALAIFDHISIIGFSEMPKADFISKVLPYRGLLPPDLISNVLAHHQNPHLEALVGYQKIRVPRPSSVLIQTAAFDLFTKWISNTGGTVQNDTYKFQLLLRGTRDGFSASVFHRRCDNKGATIVVTKSKNSEQLIGGYNPLPWTSSNSWLTTNKSFLFQSKVNDWIAANCGQVKLEHASNAIYDSSDHGPCFGSGPDLFLHGLNSSSSEIYRPAGIHNPSVSFIINEYNAERTEQTNFSTSQKCVSFNLRSEPFTFNVQPVQRSFVQQPQNSGSFTLPQDFAVQECEVFKVVKTN